MEAIVSVEATVKVGSYWAGSEHEHFYVINVMKLNEHVWVHYRKETDTEDSAREYSCYLESFLHRFRLLTNK